MTRPRYTSIVFALAGAALLIWLLVSEGIADIVAVFSLIGLHIIWIGAYRFFPILLDAQGWRQLYGKNNRPKLSECGAARWLAESVNTLLPVAQVGGHYVRARVLGYWQRDSIEAAATVTADFTIGLWTQILFTVAGLVLLFRLTGHHDSAKFLMLGVVIGVIGVGGFFLSQKAGMFVFLASRLAVFLKPASGSDLIGGARHLDRRVKEIYHRRADLAKCGLWRLAGWIARAGENWLFLYLAGIPITWQDAFVLESLSCALRNGAFLVPGGLGIQDGGLLYIGTLLGLDSSAVLALALAKRFRELLVGLPGIAWWLRLERGMWESEKIKTG